jgi:hypothetical protein
MKNENMMLKLEVKTRHTTNCRHCYNDDDTAITTTRQAACHAQTTSRINYDAVERWTGPKLEGLAEGPEETRCYDRQKILYQRTLLHITENDVATGSPSQ